MQKKSPLKKKVLLVKPPSTTTYGFPTTPPLGVGLLATILRDAGYNTKTMDMRLKKYNIKKFVEQLKNFHPHIVGFTVSSFEYLNTVNLCKIVKNFDESIITIVGGPHAAMSPQRTLEAKEIDYIGIGEADFSFKEFVSSFPDKERMGNVSGIGYVGESKNFRLNEAPELVSDLDNLPFVDMGLFPLDKYRVKGMLTIPLFTSRGCPYNCSYCISFKIQGKRYRTRSPRSLADEIEYNKRRFNTPYFTILDDTFNIDKQRVIDFCQEIIRRNLNIKWECVQGIRADRANEDIFKLMKEAGCRQIAIGIESADEDVLENINKGEDLEEIEAAINAANKVGLITKGFFIIGAPYDNREKVLKSIKFFKKNKIYIPRFSMIVVYPGAPLENWVRKNAKLFYEPYEYVTEHSELAEADAQFETNDFSRKERIRMFKYADREAEIWFIRNKLINKFGDFLGKVLSFLFYFKVNRKILKFAYRINLINVYS